MVSYLDHCALLRKECVVSVLCYQLVYQDVARILSVWQPQAAEYPTPQRVIQEFTSPANHTCVAGAAQVLV